MACNRLCCKCCTTHVTITTLEGLKIKNYIKSINQPSLLKRLVKAKDLPRFTPKMTQNRLVELCAQGEDVVDEPNVAHAGVCPLLMDQECLIYPVRPFGCRCFVSKQSCSEKGFADVDSFTLSVNYLFLQYIEHLDEKGGFGNLIDIALFLENGTHRQTYEKQAINTSGTSLINNQTISVLMIPPEYRARMEPILNKLNAIKIKQ